LQPPDERAEVRCRSLRGTEFADGVQSPASFR
jgi:hypothetical protein